MLKVVLVSFFFIILAELVLDTILLLRQLSCQLLAKECALSTGKLPRRLAQEHCG